MTATAPTSAMSFVIEALRLNPDASFAELKARAELQGLTLIPIVYGRAKLQLGLVAPKPTRKAVEEVVLREPEPVAVGLTSQVEPTATAEKEADAEADVVAEPSRVVPEDVPYVPRRELLTHARAPRAAARAATTSGSPLDQLLAHVQALAEENRRLHAALDEIRAAVEWVG